jgi:hypothetical protein
VVQRQLLDLHAASSSSEVRQSSIIFSLSDKSNNIALHVAADDKWLPEHEILLRKSIEVFTATIKDKSTIETKWVGLRLSVDQVCFRCIYCSKYNAYSDRSSFFLSIQESKRFAPTLTDSNIISDNVQMPQMMSLSVFRLRFHTRMQKKSQTCGNR